MAWAVSGSSVVPTGVRRPGAAREKAPLSEQRRKGAAVSRERKEERAAPAPLPLRSAHLASSICLGVSAPLTGTR